MKNKGFTLVELLVTLGIIAVLAAVTTPLLVKLRPDQAKSFYVKAHSTLVNTTGEILSDTSCYMTEYGNDGKATCIGLGCNSIPKYIDNIEGEELIGDISTNVKYGAILALRMGLDKDDVTHSGSKTTFRAKDGVYWEINSTESTTSVNGKNLKSITNDIVIDIDGEDRGDNCSYSSSCKKPDQFKFKVDTFGKVSAEDALGKAFLKNPYDLKASQEDRDEAEKLLGES